MNKKSFSLLNLGFLRVAVVSPEMLVADVEKNTGFIISAIEQLSKNYCQLALFPELCITGYSCADLLYQSLLLDHARQALQSISEAVKNNNVVAVVGLPLEVKGKLFDCAAFISREGILGIIPKSNLPTTNEFYEKRWFTSANHCQDKVVEINGVDIPFGTDLLFKADNMSDCTIGIEICEDLWAINPPSSDMAVAGATLLLNLSASNELVGKADYRRELVKHQSAHCLAAYLYSSAGPNESTSDVVYSGHSIIAENGIILAESERFKFTTQAITADIDLGRLPHERLKNSNYSVSNSRKSFRVLQFNLANKISLPSTRKLLRPISQTPFVPSDLNQRAKHCQEILNIQSTGLAKRLKYTGAEKITLGISGGLDSTLALLVAVRAFDTLDLDRKGIVAISMPGFGTTSRTQNNAEKIANILGVTLRRVSIHEAVRQHFRDIGHDENVYDITYENTQARERTQILMDIANQIGGFAIGTGDLSELALGWCTYNADQMSMYHVNAGVPKTLVRFLIKWIAESEFKGKAAAKLMDICATPISPELLPLGNGNVLQQKTEDSIGPYILHDFFLFYTVRQASSPRKTFFLAQQAFDDLYLPEEILHWMKLFYERFISQQFKRDAMPDGPKVGSVALSPRSDWKMPSDASFALWQKEVEKLEIELEISG